MKSSESNGAERRESRIGRRFRGSTDGENSTMQIQKTFFKSWYFKLQSAVISTFRPTVFHRRTSAENPAEQGSQHSAKIPVLVIHIFPQTFPQLLHRSQTLFFQHLS